MRRFTCFLGALTLFLFTTAPSQADLIGAVWPAPGGSTWVNTGGVSGASALATWDYSGFNSSAFSSLYYGLDQVTYGPLAATIDGAPLIALSFDSVSGTTATWSTSAPYTSASGSGDPPSGNYPIEFRMTVTGLGASPWVDATTLGLPANVGAVADNSSGQDFTVNFEFVADLGSGFIPLNSVPGPGGHVGSSFADGFYYAAIPETSSFLFGGMICGLLLAKPCFKRLRKKTS